MLALLAKIKSCKFYKHSKTRCQTINCVKKNVHSLKQSTTNTQLLYLKKTIRFNPLNIIQYLLHKLFHQEPLLYGNISVNLKQEQNVKTFKKSLLILKSTTH